MNFGTIKRAQKTYRIVNPPKEKEQLSQVTADELNLPSQA